MPMVDMEAIMAEKLNYKLVLRIESVLENISNMNSVGRLAAV